MEIKTIDSQLQALMDKYNLFFINGKRYYEFDMTTKLPILENAVPYVFKYKDIEIYETSWKHISFRILEEIDKLSPKSEEYLLNLRYWWSKTEVFSTSQHPNFTPFKGIYLNTNHTAIHAMMSIQCLLNAYNIDPSECYFVVRRHPIAEPFEVREYFKNKTVDGFKKSMIFRGFSEKRIETVINNFRVINQLLGMVSQGYYDFFLFDDYQNFVNYKVNVIKKTKHKFISNQKNVDAVVNTLDKLDDYYKNKSFYDTVSQISLPDNFKDLLKDEIEFLFSNLKTPVISVSKLHARMSLIHKDLMLQLGDLNNKSDLFRFVTALFGKDYCCKKPFISKDESITLEHDDLLYSFAYEQDEVSVSKLNNYSTRMHFKKVFNYVAFFTEISDDYVLVDQERAVKKDLFDIEDKKIDDIRHELEYYIRSFGAIDSEKYNGYSSLPKLTRLWNKYLLLGIVRTYLKEHFKIAYSGGTYKTFTFTIDLL